MTQLATRPPAPSRAAAPPPPPPRNGQWARACRSKPARQPPTRPARERAPAFSGLLLVAVGAAPDQAQAAHHARRDRDGSKDNGDGLHIGQWRWDKHMVCYLRRMLMAARRLTPRGHKGAVA